MTTETRNCLVDIPMYASKPQRKVAGIDNVVAVTMYASGDKSVRTVALFSADGIASLGTVHYQPRRRFFTSGYTLRSVPSISDEKWSTLAEAAAVLAERLDVDLAKHAR